MQAAIAILSALYLQAKAHAHTHSFTAYRRAKVAHVRMNLVAIQVTLEQGRCSFRPVNELIYIYKTFS